MIETVSPTVKLIAELTFHVWRRVEEGVTESVEKIDEGPEVSIPPVDEEDERSGEEEEL